MYAKLKKEEVCVKKTTRKTNVHREYQWLEMVMIRIQKQMEMGD